MRIMRFINIVGMVRRQPFRQYAGKSLAGNIAGKSGKFQSAKEMDSEVQAYFSYALTAVREAGQLMIAKVGKSTVEAKSSDIDLVTETDKAVETLFTKHIQKKYPAHKFIGEETVAAGSKLELTEDPTWIIDPIDGTMNFVHAFPHYCISIALFIEKEPKLGIIYNPVLEQMFSATLGHGAYFNGRPIHVSKQKELQKALLMMEVGTSRDPIRLNVLYRNQQTLIPKIRGVRTLGSAALNMAMVALGCADAYFEFGIHIWDMAAGEIIVKEAGGVVIDPSGGAIDRMSRRVLCAGTQELADRLCQTIVQYYPTPTD